MKAVTRARWVVAVLAAWVAGCGSGTEAEFEPDLSEETNALLMLAQSTVATGQSFSCALVEGGGVKCWGENTFGQLGYGDFVHRGMSASHMGDNLKLVDLGAGRTAKQVAVGDDHACALLDTNQIKCWGKNSSGQLGLGDIIHRGGAASQMGDALPTVNLGTGRSAKALIAGYDQTCAILDTNQLKCWGFNGRGHLGLGDLANRGIAPGQMGDGLPPVSLGAGRTVKQASTNGVVTCAVLDDNSAKCWGQGAYLGQGTLNDRGDAAGEMGDALLPIALGAGRTAKQIKVGFPHVCALLDNNQVKCWGGNLFGQLGQGDTATRGDAAGEMGDALLPIALGAGRTAKSVTAMGDNTCALLDTNQVKCWGYNWWGTLGLGDTQHRGDHAGEMGDFLPAAFLGTGRSVSSVALGFGYVCAVLDNRRLKCWGRNGWGEPGYGSNAMYGDQPGEMGDSLPYTDLGSRGAMSIVSRGATTCALLFDGKVKCWGFNASGELGQGDEIPRGNLPGQMGAALPPISLGTGRTAKQVVVGSAFACALLDNNQVKCWGTGSFGQLGAGDTELRGDQPGEMGDALPNVNLGTGRTAKGVFAGQDFACAILDTNQLKCWGNNVAGQLGYGDVVRRGDAAGEMGDSLPVVDFGAGRTVKNVSLGLAHGCAVLDNDQLKCWGYNGDGQLGLGDVATRGDAAGEMGDALPPVALGTSRFAKAVYASTDYTCALLNNGSVKCWGENNLGQLGLGDVATRGDEPGEMGDALLPVALGTGRKALALAAGISSNCAILDNRDVKCWGRNNYGQLGQGDLLTRGDAAGEMGDFLLPVYLGTALVARAPVASTPFHTPITQGSHACVLTQTGQVKCWGRNQSGQLGLGDAANRGDTPGELGNSLPITQLGPES